MNTNDNAILLITHYYKMLNFVTPDVVSIIVDGTIVDQGGKELALTIEHHGFKAYTKEGNNHE